MRTQSSHELEAWALTRWPDGVCLLQMNWAMRWDLRCCLKLY